MTTTFAKWVLLYVILDFVAFRYEFDVIRPKYYFDKLLSFLTELLYHFGNKICEITIYLTIDVAYYYIKVFFKNFVIFFEHFIDFLFNSLLKELFYWLYSYLETGVNFIKMYLSPFKGYMEYMSMSHISISLKTLIFLMSICVFLIMSYLFIKYYNKKKKDE